MSKKLALGILLSALLVGQFLPLTAGAAITTAPESCEIRKKDKVASYLGDCNGGKPKKCNYDQSERPCALCCLLGTIFYVTDIVFIGLIVMVMVFVLLGAFKILTAGGSTEQINQGRDFILYALVGFAMAILAKGMPAVISFVLT